MSRSARSIALVAGRWIAPLLFDVSPKDPPVMVAVIVTLLAVAVRGELDAGAARGAGRSERGASSGLNQSY